MGVEQTGFFRSFVKVEALTDSSSPATSAASKASNAAGGGKRGIDRAGGGSRK